MMQLKNTLPYISLTAPVNPPAVRHMFWSLSLLSQLVCHINVSPETLLFFSFSFVYYLFCAFATFFLYVGVFLCVMGHTTTKKLS